MHRKSTIYKLKLYGAFTLTEVMIVMVLLGVMLAFAIPNYQKGVDKAHERDAKLQLTTLHAASKIYFAKNNQYLAGNNLNLSQINTGLGTNILANGMTYSYTSPAPYNTFTAQAIGNNFTLQITENPVEDAGGNPCCFSGTCQLTGGC